MKRRESLRGEKVPLKRGRKLSRELTKSTLREAEYDVKLKLERRG